MTTIENNFGGIMEKCEDKLSQSVANGVKSHRLTLERIVDSFPDAYITLLSILQSAIIGYLIFTVEHNWRSFDGDPERWIRSFTTLFCVVIIWNEYRMGSTLLNWIPGISDILIPFCFVVGEVFIVAAVNDCEPKKWVLWISILYFFGIVAFNNMYAKSETLNKMFFARGGCSDRIDSLESVLITNQFVLKIIEPYKTRNPVICIYISMLHFAFYLILDRDNVNSDNYLYLTISASMLNCLFFLRSKCYWDRVITKIKTDLLAK